MANKEQNHPEQNVVIDHSTNNQGSPRHARPTDFEVVTAAEAAAMKYAGHCQHGESASEVARHMDARARERHYKGGFEQNEHNPMSPRMTSPKLVPSQKKTDANFRRGK